MEKFDIEMLKLNKDLEILLKELEDIMDITLNSLINIDVSGIERIKNMDINIYHKTKEIETKTINMILLYSPFAKDLRKLITILKIIIDIDRIGRYSYDISLLIPAFAE
ncbi:MAG TPA: hypothetical protein ENO35_02910, partial [Euryarchaeota archaeon]|nr:hypothetical protein [Euryarchaeota archaeon]